jgi:hypothetical protein
MKRPQLVYAGVVVQLAALGLLAVAYSKRHDATVEGAYFNRSPGVDTAAYATSSDVGPWILAAGMLVTLGTALMAAGWVVARSR